MLAVVVVVAVAELVVACRFCSASNDNDKAIACMCHVELMIDALHTEFTVATTSEITGSTAKMVPHVQPAEVCMYVHFPSTVKKTKDLCK